MIHIENGKVQLRGKMNDVLYEATVALKSAVKELMDQIGTNSQPEEVNTVTLGFLESCVEDIKAELLGDRAETEQDRIHSLLCKIDSLAEDHYNRERNEGKSHDQALETTAEVMSDMLAASTIGIKMMLRSKASRNEEEPESCEEEEKSSVPEL